MSVDTRDRRMSLIGMGMTGTGVLSDPANVSAAANRQMLLGLYAFADVTGGGPTTMTISGTLDAALLGPRSIFGTLDAALLIAGRNGSLSLDAYLTHPYSIIGTLDAALMKSGSGSVTLDAVIGDVNQAIGRRTIHVNARPGSPRAPARRGPIIVH